LYFYLSNYVEYFVQYCILVLLGVVCLGQQCRSGAPTSPQRVGNESL